MWYSYRVLSEHFIRLNQEPDFAGIPSLDAFLLLLILFRPSLRHRMTTPDQDMLEQAWNPRITLTSYTSILLNKSMGNHDSIRNGRQGNIAPVSKG